MSLTYSEKENDQPFFHQGHGLSFYIRRSEVETIVDNPKPTCLYFTASWKDSLYHQELSKLTTFLLNKGIDVISCDIPFHHESMTSYDTALNELTHNAQIGNKVVIPYAQALSKSLLEMHDKQIISLTGFAIAGLSRGAFCALHVVNILSHLLEQREIENTIPIALLAPLLHLLSREEHLTEPDSIERELFPLRLPIPPLFLSIGNADKRVGTDTSLMFFKKFSDESSAILKKSKKGSLSSSCIDSTLHVYPSIGFQGHGTPSSVFDLASSWIENRVTNKNYSKLINIV